MLPYGRQQIDDADVRAVVDALRSDWITTGPRVSEFEEAFAAKVRAGFAVALSSGTAALHAAAFAAGIAPGNEAIVTPLTFVASANCVRYQGGTVVFADVRPDTLNLNPQFVEAAVTNRTRAIVTVDYAGQPSDIEELRALAHRHGITLIEDAAHALGATYRGRSVGGLADLTVFSLHPVKHITSGEGGMVTTNHADLAGRVRSFRNHGIRTDHLQRSEAGTWLYDMVDLGYNYRITDFQCALGASQLRKLDGWVTRRREIAARYDGELSNLNSLQTPVVLSDRESAWHLYTVRLRLERLSVDRGEIFRALRAENIGVNVHYIPVPWHSYYASQGYSRGQWPVAESAYEELLTLPIFPAMSDRDIDDVLTAVGKVLNHYAR